MAYRILVTGGLGYIGTHVVASLLDLGHEVITLDIAVPASRRPLMPGEEFVLGDCADYSASQSRLDMIGPVDGVVHLAAMVDAPQSMLIPEVFYRVNASGTLNMLELATRLSATAFLFASSAAVYGSLPNRLCEDQVGMTPENPYGGSKLFGERICYDVAHRRKISLGVLRFFNVVGARETLTVKPPATNLLGHIFRAIKTERNRINIFGKQHATRDGFCVRDFVNVKSVSEGVIRTLLHLLSGTKGYRLLYPMNIGTGIGQTVYEVFTAAKSQFPALEYDLHAAREGEVSISIADTTRIQQQLEWVPPPVDILQALKEEYHVRSKVPLLSF